MSFDDILPTELFAGEGSAVVQLFSASRGNRYGALLHRQSSKAVGDIVVCGNVILFTVGNFNAFFGIRVLGLTYLGL